MLKDVDWLTLSGGSPLEGQSFRDPVAGQAKGQRYNWEERIAAGTTVNMLELTHTPFRDAVLMYSSGPASTEPCSLLISQTNSQCEMPIGLSVGPRGGGQVRITGGISVTATALNVVAGFADVRIWIIPDAQVQHVPPVSAFDVAFPQATPTTISPDAASSGWPPPQRPCLTFMSTQNCTLDFLNPAGAVGGSIQYAPAIANRELELIHPPFFRLQVTNTGAVPGGIIATWSRI